ncbi:unnamed protein product [Ixodes pacificus]
MPPQSRCHRCGAQHPSQNEDGSHYECQPLCAICGACTSRPPKNAHIAMFAALRCRGPAPTQPERQRRRSRRAEAEALPGIEVSRRIASPKKTGRRGRLHLRPVLSPRWSRN